MVLRLTRDGYEKLRSELEFLRTTKRREVIKAIETARAHGDLRENAEYDAAKNEQAFLEKRISELDGMLAGVMILDHEDIDVSKVYLGATVTVLDSRTNKDVRYMLVNKEEANLKEQKISVDSPIGKALLGRSVGDEVEVVIPAGTLRFKIQAIER